MRPLSMLILLLLSTSLPCQAGPLLTVSNSSQPFVVEEIASGIGVPWGMTFVAPSTLLVTERKGGIYLLDPKEGQFISVQGGPQVLAQGQGGMLDVAVPPGFRPGGWIYFTYSKSSNGQGVTTLARARLQHRALTDWQDLFITESASDSGRHFGSRITFDLQGHLFFSVGDRGVRENGQDRTNHAGTILRLNLDGTVPGDNPFAAGKSQSAIWSYGHRNPQGIFWSQSTGTLWANEHGPRGGDEINVILPGANYGWPVVSHGKEYWGPVDVGEATSKPGMVDPIKVYIPSIAPGSLIVYSGKAFPQWKNNLFSGALKLRHLNRVAVDRSLRPTLEERLLTELDERIRNVIEGPEGWLYLSTDSGRILRIRPPKG